MTTTDRLEHKPQAQSYREKIGDQHFQIEERELQAFDEVALWADNPRLQQVPGTDAEEFPSQEELEDRVRRTKGYNGLRQSIDHLGQMEPIYAWRRDGMAKYLVLEGATRVTVVRELFRKHQNDPQRQKSPMVKAKILPPDFGIKYRRILLARIHVRGTGVRAWDRFIQAKFVWDSVQPGEGAMIPKELADHMEKSLSWVTRLQHAYAFAQKFKDHVDSPDKDHKAVEQFSVLEEISKSRTVGPMLRSYDDPEHDQLREDVFEMVQNGVFKEYRDARFMKEFLEDPDKWAQLKSGQPNIANLLAADIRSNSSGLKGKINGLEGHLRRSLERDSTAIDEDDLVALQRALQVAEDVLLDPGISPVRRGLVKFTKQLEQASLADVVSIRDQELAAFDMAYADVKERRERRKARD